MENLAAWDLDEAVGYYESIRNKPEDIYESERVFLFPLIEKSGSVLDIGCAAGGFYNIIHSLNPSINYTGLDTSEGMIRAATAIFPEADFRLAGAETIDFPDNSFDLVMALGVLNHIPDYRNFIRECYRVSKRYCLLDLPRLLPNKHTFNKENSYMILKERFHSGKSIDSARTKVPYVLVDAAEAFDFLLNDLKPGRILAKGYFGKCDKSVTIPVQEVCFTVACIEKSCNKNTALVADLPKKMLEYLKEEKFKVLEPFEVMLK